MTQMPYYRNTDKTANIGDLVVVEVGFRGTPDKYVGKTAVVYSTANDDDRCTDGSTNDLQLVFEDGVRSAWWEAGHLRLIKTEEFAIARQIPCPSSLSYFAEANSPYIPEMNKETWRHVKLTTVTTMEMVVQ